MSGCNKTQNILEYTDYVLNAYIYWSFCFYSELVSWLVMTKEAADDEQAVIVGQGLLESGLIHHGEHPW